jgi:hypothetical protein
VIEGTASVAFWFVFWQKKGMFRIGGLEAWGGWRMEEAEDRSGFSVIESWKFSMR